MDQKLLAIVGLAVLAIAVPATAVDLDSILTPDQPWTAIHCDSPEVQTKRDLGLDPYTHEFVDPSSGLIVTIHLLCLGEVIPQEELLTDCTATGYSFTGWKWTWTENYRVDTWNPSGISASTVVSQFQSSGDVWDGQVAANIYGSVSSGGSRANIPVYDGYNQFGWKDLSSGTIASTWTWKSSSSVSALESDAAYNTDFAWSSSGESNKMDLRNIATHELGHTFGLGHSTSGSCLTMYPSGSLGETQKRSLGDGDIYGIRARYP